MKTCLLFMPKEEIQHENKIKAVLDHQLVNLRMYNADPRAPSHDMAGLRSTYSVKKSVNIPKNPISWKPEPICIYINNHYHVSCIYNYVPEYLDTPSNQFHILYLYPFTEI